MRQVVTRNTDPPSEAVFFILVSLAEEPKHGYAILQNVEQISKGRVRLSTGTLYGAIRRLLDSRMIARVSELKPSRDRQVYRLMPLGHAALVAEVGRMKELTRAAARLVEKPA